MSSTPYVCDCDSGTFTEGNQCERCASNRFHNNAQFDCQGQCDCQEEGVVNATQMCDMVSLNLWV